MQHGKASFQKYRRLISNEMSAYFVHLWIQEKISDSIAKADRFVQLAIKYQNAENHGACKLYTKRASYILEHKLHYLKLTDKEVLKLLDKYHS